MLRIMLANARGRADIGARGKAFGLTSDDVNAARPAAAISRRTGPHRIRMPRAFGLATGPRVAVAIARGGTETS